MKIPHLRLRTVILLCVLATVCGPLYRCSVFVFDIFTFNGDDFPSQYKLETDIPKRYQPVLNQHPKYFVTLNGYVAPSLRKNLKFKWIMSYSTYNEKCEVEANWLEGAYVSREIDLAIPVIIDGKGYFHAKLPLDLYQPGFCQWKLEELQYMAHSTTALHSKKASVSEAKNAVTFISFSKHSTTPENESSTRVVWSCSNLDCSDIKLMHNSGFYADGDYISRDKNYIINFKLIRRKKSG